MLNKFIDNIKNSLSKKKASTEESDDAESSSQENAEDSEESSSSEDKTPKSNRNSMIFRVVIILGLAYVAVDQFILSDNKQEEVVTAVKPKRKNKKLPPNEAAKNANAGDAATAGAKAGGTDAQAAVKDSAANPTDPNAKPAETNGSVTDAGLKDAPKEMPKDETKQEKISEAKQETKPEEKADEKPAPVVAETKTEAPIENVNITAKPSEEAAKPVTGEVDSSHLSLGEAKSKEKELDKHLDQLISGEVDKTDTAKKAQDDLKSKIVVEDTYVEPPNYDDVGRGLVYDCKEKRWICIDKQSYVQCNKNMKYNKGHSKAVECAVVNVYGSTEDCGLIQKFYVSTNKSTEFCN